MSWIQDEWKENLSSDVRSHITSMEESLEKLQKDISQYQFKTESLSATVDNLNGKLNGKENDLKESERELIQLQTELEEEQKKNMELNAQIKNKDYSIENLNTQIEHLSRVIEQHNLESSSSEQQLSKNILKEKETDQKDNELEIQINKFKETEQHLREEQAHLQQQIAELVAENGTWKVKASDLENQLNAKSNIDEINADERRYREEYREDRIEDELNENKQSGQIGDYLGINIDQNATKSSSDSRIRMHNYTLLAEENKRLQKELEKLRNEHVVMRLQSDILDTNGNANNNENIDSGVSLPARVDNNNENITELTEELKLRKSEVKKLKCENMEMKEIYENHMKICGNRKYSTERNNGQQENDVGKEKLTRSKSEVLGSLQANVKSGFTNLEQKYRVLEKKLTDISTTLVSNPVHNKIEQLTNLMAEEKKEASMSNWNMELDQLKSDLISNFFTVQDEVHKGNIETKEEINSAMTIIMDYIQQHERKTLDMNGDKYRNISSRRRGMNNYVDEKKGNNINKNIFHVSASNSIGELETIKERIGNVQQSISESNNERRKLEVQRDKIQEELVKMVETLKRKEEEIGHIKQLYEEEKKKVNENDACFRTEMEELQREQLEIYNEFRQMCETLKRKDIELSNKNKQIKLLNAESREKEDELRNTISSLESDKAQINDEKEEITKQYHEKSCEFDTLLKKFVQATDQLETIFKNLSKIEGVCLKAKSQGLYK